MAARIAAALSARQREGNYVARRGDLLVRSINDSASRTLGLEFRYKGTLRRSGRNLPKNAKLGLRENVPVLEKVLAAAVTCASPPQPPARFF